MFNLRRQGNSSLTKKQGYIILSLTVGFDRLVLVLQLYTSQRLL